MKKKSKNDLTFDTSKMKRLKIDKDTVITHKVSGEKYFFRNGKKVVIEKRDSKNHHIHINVSTGERFIYQGGKKKILKKKVKKLRN